MAREVVSGATTVQEAAEEFRTCAATVRKWLRRYQLEGVEGMMDRSSRPRSCPWQITVSTTAEVEVLRRKRMTGDQIAQQLRISRATVYRVLRRRRLNRMAAIDPPAPVERYEHASPGGLLHIDIKKLGCIGRIGHRIHGDRRRSAPGVGWEFVHVAIDDHSRLAFSRIFTDEKHTAAIAFLRPRSSITPLSGSASSACSATTAVVIALMLSVRSAPNSAFAGVSPGPIVPAPTAKPNALSKPSSGNGPMPPPTTIPLKGLHICPHGYIITTGIVLTVVWMTNRLSVDLASIGITS